MWYFMIELKLDKSFIKNTIQTLGEKEFGKESKEFKEIFGVIVEKIKQLKLLIKNWKQWNKSCAKLNK